MRDSWCLRRRGLCRRLWDDYPLPAPPLANSSVRQVRGLGAAGAEEPLVPNLSLMGTNASDHSLRYGFRFPVAKTRY